MLRSGRFFFDECFNQDSDCERRCEFDVINGVT